MGIRSRRAPRGACMISGSLSIPNFRPRRTRQSFRWDPKRRRGRSRRSAPRLSVGPCCSLTSEELGHEELLLRIQGGVERAPRNKQDIVVVVRPLGHGDLGHRRRSAPLIGVARRIQPQREGALEPCEVFRKAPFGRSDGQVLNAVVVRIRMSVGSERGREPSFQQVEQHPPRRRLRFR